MVCRHTLQLILIQCAATSPSPSPNRGEPRPSPTYLPTYLLVRSRNNVNLQTHLEEGKMCFYTQYQFSCEDLQTGPLYQHCDQCDCSNGAACLGATHDETPCKVTATCGLVVLSNTIPRSGECRTCRKVPLTDELRIREDIELRYYAIDTAEESLLRHRRRMLRRLRAASVHYYEYVNHQEASIKRLEEAILFLASGSVHKEVYTANFLKNCAQRQVDREIGFLDAQFDILSRKRTEYWTDMTTILDQ